MKEKEIINRIWNFEESWSHGILDTQVMDKLNKIYEAIGGKKIQNKLKYLLIEGSEIKLLRIPNHVPKHSLGHYICSEFLFYEKSNLLHVDPINGATWYVNRRKLEPAKNILEINQQIQQAKEF